MPSTDVLKSLRRLGKFPLDESMVFHNEAELDAYYLDDSPVRGNNVYDGQICYVKRGDTLDSTFVYILRENPKTNKFEKVRILTEDNCVIEFGNLYTILKGVVREKILLPTNAKKGDAYLVKARRTDDNQLIQSNCLYVKLTDEPFVFNDTNCDEFWYDAGPIKGDKGDVGEQGPTGPRGLLGPTGPRGATGPRGDTGLQGDIGDTGETGDTGERGETGPTGPRGIRGEIGPIGPTGPRGEVGKGLRVDYIYHSWDDYEVETLNNNICYHVADIAYIKSDKMLYIYNFNRVTGEYEWLPMAAKLEIGELTEDDIGKFLTVIRDKTTGALVMDWTHIDLSMSLDRLTDTEITDPEDNDVLKYKDGKWINAKTDATTTKDIEFINSEIGSYKPGDVISSGTTFTEIMTNMAQKLKEPEFNLKCTYPQEVEVGEKIQPELIPSFIQNQGGSITKYSLVRNNLAGNLSTTFGSYTDSYNINEEKVVYTANVEYGDGIKYDSGMISGSTLQSTYEITGRRVLWAFSCDQLATIGTNFDDLDSAVEDALKNAINTRSIDHSGIIPEGQYTHTLEVDTDNDLVCIAVPKAIFNSMTIEYQGDTTMKDLFNVFETPIDGKNGLFPTNYVIAYYRPFIPFVEPTNFIINLG